LDLVVSERRPDRCLHFLYLSFERETGRSVQFSVAHDDLKISGFVEMKKGSVLSTAQLAGIIGAKKTADLIPLCHPVPLTHVGLEFELLKEDHSLSIVSSASTANVWSTLSIVAYITNHRASMLGRVLAEELLLSITCRHKPV